MKNPDLSKIKTPIIVVVIFLFLTQMSALVLRHYAGKVGSKLTSTLDDVSHLQSQKQNYNYHLTQVEARKVQTLNNIISKHKNHHKDTFLTLYKFHFTSVALLTFFSIAVGVLALIIGQKGWKEVNMTTQTMFLTCGALASFYALSMNVFNQNDGIKKNIRTYVNYDNIQKNVLNYCATKSIIPNQGDTTHFNVFHEQVITEMIELNGIYLEFDEEAIKNRSYLNKNTNVNSGAH